MGTLISAPDENGAVGTLLNASVGGDATNYTGWRVLRVSNGEVTLVSAGTPLKYTVPSDLTELTYDLTTNIFDETNYSANAFTGKGIEGAEDGAGVGDATGKTMAEIFESVAALSSENKGVTSITKYDIERAMLQELANGDSVSEGGSMLVNGGAYCVLGAETAGGVSDSAWYIDEVGTLNQGLNGATEIGVRLQITLKQDIRTTGKTSGGTWQIDMP